MGKRGKYFIIFLAFSMLIATEGQLTITPIGLFYQLPASIIAWKLAFSSIAEATRLAPEKSSVFSFRTGGGSILIKSKPVCTEKLTWTCQVCEELNETNDSNESQAKCSVCGSIQKGTLQVIKLEMPQVIQSEPWECDVCQEANEATSQKCQVCGFSCTKTPSEPTSIESPKEQTEFQVLLQFTKGGSQVFMERLQPFLSSNATLKQEEEMVVGIAGLLRRQEARGRATEETLEGAFSDLDALMQRASVMVKLASQLSSKLNGDSELKRLISGLQLDSSLSISNASSFSLSLAKSIEQICLKLGKNVYSLADIYLLYNRSLGSNFVSPADLRRGAEEMSANGLKFVLFSFKQGGTLCLVQRELSGDGLRSRLLDYLKNEMEFMTPLQWSQASSLSLQLATEQLEMANQKGWLVCDAKRPDLTPSYYRNLIKL